jgi:hypothetical protein
MRDEDLRLLSGTAAKKYVDEHIGATDTILNYIETKYTVNK